jgi:hypothetical protein
MKKFFLFFIFLFLILFPTLVKAEKGTIPPPEITELLCDYNNVTKKWDCYIDRKKEIKVFTTDYFIGEVGTVYIQLLEKWQPVNSASCLLDLWYPDKTKWLTQAPMQLISPYGIYYYDIEIPDKEGIGLVSVYCWYIMIKLDNFANYYNLTLGQYISGKIEDTYHKDGRTLDFRESNDRLNIIFDFIYSSPSNLTQLDIFLWAKWGNLTEELVGKKTKLVQQEKEKLDILIWNFNESRWEILPNKIKPSDKILPTNNGITENISNYIGIFNATHNITRIMINDTEINDITSELNLDYLMIRIEYLSGAYIEDIRGGGEVHIISPSYITIPSIEDISSSVWKKFLVYGTPPLMPSTSYQCLDNQTLIKKIPRTVCFDKKCENITIEEEIKCQYGCNFETNECNPPTWQPFAYIMGGLIAIMFLIVIVYKLVSR